MTTTTVTVAPPPRHVAAARIARFGWHVFPLVANGKTPATKHGLHDATSDVERITRWWRKHPDHNLGINCGASGLLVVDIDMKDVDGFANWCELGSKHEEHIPATLTVCTASRPFPGEHWYFTVDSSHGIGNSAGKLGSGIDVRAIGGYVVSPPSTIDGAAYVVDENHDVAPAPDWLIDALKKPAPRVLPPGEVHANGDGTPYGQRALESELGRLAVAPEGCRNDQLNQAAHAIGQLAAGGQIDPVNAANQLEAVALRIGLDHREIEQTIRSRMTAGAANPRRPA